MKKLGILLLSTFLLAACGQDEQSSANNQSDEKY